MALTGALQCALLWLVVAAAVGHLTQEQMDSIVDLHNTYRATVQPEAADMTRMTWSEESRLVAENYASQCIWDHNPDVQNILGENLFITTGPLNISMAMFDWFKEYEDYDYDNNQCSDFKLCGHYTQMVWAKTTSVGCAANICDNIQGLSFINSTFLVCNYFPPGNVMGHKPYQAGEQCSQCPQDRTVCVEKTCDTEHVNIIPSIDRENVDLPNKATTGTLMFARPSAIRLMLAGLLASLML